MAEHSIVQVGAEDSDALDLVRDLYSEYHAWLGQSICSHRLAEEITSLPGPYALPTGRLYLARNRGGLALGCIAVKPAGGDDCEIKRLFVREAARGTGLGSALLVQAIGSARELGYRRALITTLPLSMPVARSMYERAGFVETQPFADHSHVDPGVVMEYLALEL